MGELLVIHCIGGPVDGRSELQPKSQFAAGSPAVALLDGPHGVLYNLSGIG